MKSPQRLQQLIQKIQKQIYVYVEMCYVTEAEFQTRAERLEDQQMLWEKLPFLKPIRLIFFTPFARMNSRCIKELNIKRL